MSTPEELEVIRAADSWAREVLLKEEKPLKPTEQNLLNAVLKLRASARTKSSPPPPIPKAPKVPQEFDWIKKKV